MKLYVINHYNGHYESVFKLIGVVDENKLDDAIEQIKTRCNFDDEDIENYIDLQEIELNELDI